MNNAQPTSPPTPPARRSNPNRPRQITQTIEIQEVLWKRCLSPETSDKDLASLAASFSRITDTLRVLRGIPDPGRFCPESDVNALLKQLKRARAYVKAGGGLRMLGGGAMAGGFIDADEAEAERVIVEEKESLTAGKGGDGVGEGEGPIATGQ